MLRGDAAVPAGPGGLLRVRPPRPRHGQALRPPRPLLPSAGSRRGSAPRLQRRAAARERPGRSLPEASRGVPLRAGSGIHGSGAVPRRHCRFWAGNREAAGPGLQGYVPPRDLLQKGWAACGLHREPEAGDRPGAQQRRRPQPSRPLLRGGGFLRRRQEVLQHGHRARPLLEVPEQPGARVLPARGDRRRAGPVRGGDRGLHRRPGGRAGDGGDTLQPRQCPLPARPAP
mmetsp:Transcript_30621/g.81269  ORF Transcript_30621/g.81269 Transcript_30621/m.81269 type:complete len:229 (+) Transcript_30621:257-943(+)